MINHSPWLILRTNEKRIKSFHEWKSNQNKKRNFHMKFGELNNVRLWFLKTENWEMQDTNDVKNSTVRTLLREKKKCCELLMSKDESMKTVKNKETSDFELIKYNQNEATDQIFVKECFMKFLKFQIKLLICCKRQTAKRLIDEIGMNGFNFSRMMWTFTRNRQKLTLWLVMNHYLKFLMKIN